MVIRSPKAALRTFSPTPLTAATASSAELERKRRVAAVGRSKVASLFSDRSLDGRLVGLTTSFEEAKSFTIRSRL